jgi:hypothetical protein
VIVTNHATPLVLEMLTPKITPISHAGPSPYAPLLRRAAADKRPARAS